MEATDKPITTQESISIIQEMIEKVKSGFEDKSFYYLLWGWLVLIASLGNYVLMKLNYPSPEIMWLLMPAGALATVIYSYRTRHRKKVRSYIDEFLRFVLISFGISLLIVLFFSSKLGLGAYPMVMLIYGTWLFTSGGVIRFRPLILGGIINWLLACSAFFTPFDVQLLLLGLAVLTGYIIPGYLLKAHFRNVQRA